MVFGKTGSNNSLAVDAVVKDVKFVEFVLTDFPGSHESVLLEMSHYWTDLISLREFCWSGASVGFSQLPNLCASEGFVPATMAEQSFFTSERLTGGAVLERFSGWK